KKVLRSFGIPVPRGIPAQTAEETARAFEELGSPLAVVKAQIHAGGRGKAGGVVLVRSADEAREVAERLLGTALVTHQTGREGQIVRQLSVEEGSSIDRELYLAIGVDRTQSAPVMIAAAEGGVDIEELAAERPEAISKEVIHPIKGLLPFQTRRLCFALGLRGPQMKGAAKIMGGLARAFSELDCSLAEINPLIVTEAGEVLALDAKINFDANALFRHGDMLEYRDLNEEDPKEVEAAEHELSYIALDGNIGCMVNGAGLAMATMDVIQLKGGKPANFLDVGGGADEAQVKAAFKILLSDDRVKGVLINIFGGIMKCDIIAEGVVKAAREVQLDVPLVVRLEGTNAGEGREILAGSELALQTAESLDEAASMVVSLVMSGELR
ncbi:MAG: ADP-forming succinate--CoA ligase subunit beta, partial [Acidobacteria bacterium]|nr:ADP-forming succinate--CoA ligase subunit beta [Acidobacteriota bacterium]